MALAKRVSKPRDISWTTYINENTWRYERGVLLEIEWSRELYFEVKKTFC